MTWARWSQAELCCRQLSAEKPLSSLHHLHLSLTGAFVSFPRFIKVESECLRALSRAKATFLKLEGEKQSVPGDPGPPQRPHIPEGRH